MISREIHAGRFSLILLLALTSVISARGWAQSTAQVTGPEGGVPALPAGEGTVRGRIILPGNIEAGANLDVVLYALQANGQPGLQRGKADQAGFFSFENVSSDPSTIYLLGTQYQDVPFGQRVTFANGEDVAEVVLPLRAIRSDPVEVRIEDTTYKLDWVGGQLFVQATHQLHHDHEDVYFVPENEREGRSPLFTARLPDAFNEFVSSPGGLEQGLEQRDQNILFWGPIYPGDQEIRYGFLLDTENLDPAQPGQSQNFPLSWTLPEGAAQVILLTPTGEPTPTGKGVETLPRPLELEGRSYVQNSLGRRAPGEGIEFLLPVPAASNDRTRLKIKRADYWLEADDTSMQVNAEFTLSVDSGLRLLSRDGQGLLRLPFPKEAEFLGLSGSAESVGLGPHPEGGLTIRGPLPPGPTSLGVRYRVPVQNGIAQLDLDFDRPVDILNVLVADTGVVVESPRLHKRRPFQSGTRIYLHREAYQLRAGEPVPIAIIPFERQAISSQISALAGLSLGIAVAAWLIVPLRRAQKSGGAAVPLVSEWAIERETIYENIRDLEHDRETGKVEERDYERMRSELRAAAIELMRQERGPQTGAAAERPATSTHAASFCT
ncbi:MAG: hypothetical protein P8M78_12130, partial [Myxococcota bacterium]|nr:hypothetical protein [Myxococcota bacterium]